MAGEQASQNRAVERLSGAQAAAYGCAVASAASNGAVTRSKSIAERDRAQQMDACDAYEQTDRSCCSLGWG